MIQIREEIRAVEEGKLDREDNPLLNAPHTAAQVSASEWTRAYPRELAAFPLATLRQQKYWPPVARVDNVHGDKNVFCSCIPIGSRSEEHTSELQSLMRISYAVFRLKKKKTIQHHANINNNITHHNHSQTERYQVP